MKAAPDDPAPIHTIVAVAGQRTPFGVSLSADALRQQADNVYFFWDEPSQTLYFQGLIGKKHATVLEPAREDP